jgi:hypothetical protein
MGVFTFLGSADAESSGQEVVLVLKFPNNSSSGTKKKEDHRECAMNDTLNSVVTLSLDGHKTELAKGMSYHLRLGQKLVDSSWYVTHRWFSSKTKKCISDENHNQEICSKRCQARLALSVCHCLPWHLSRIDVQGENHPICGDHKLVCINEIEQGLSLAPLNLTLAEMVIRNQDLGWTSSTPELRQQCQCYPSCNLASHYTVESITDDHNCNVSQEALEVIRIRLGMDSATSGKYRRRVVMPLEILIGVTGGIFAIFVGFGIMTIFEIVYFFTVRLYDNHTDPILRKRSDTEQLDQEVTRRASDTELLNGNKIIFQQFRN